MSERPRAITAKTVPCTRPPMMICAAWFTPRGHAGRSSSWRQRRTCRLADRDPALLRGIPERHHRILDAETTLRHPPKIIGAVDPGEALEMTDMLAQLRRGGAGAELPQPGDEDRHGIPGMCRGDIRLDSRRLVGGIEFLLRREDTGLALGV